MQVVPPVPGSPAVSIILATLNERGNLPELVERIRAQPLPPFEIIVVDDGSTDGTRQFVSELAQHDPRVRLIEHEGKQTTVRAQCQGIEAARSARIVIMDADLQHPPESLPALIGALGGNVRLSVASRYAPGGSPGARPWSRAVISRGAEWIARRRLAEARSVSDPVSGFFAFERAIFHPLDPSYRGYKLLLFVLVMNAGLPVAEVGFRFSPRGAGRSKVTDGLGFVRVFLAELRLAREFRASLRASTPATRGPDG